MLEGFCQLGFACRKKFIFQAEIAANRHAVEIVQHVCPPSSLVLLNEYLIIFRLRGFSNFRRQVRPANRRAAKSNPVRKLQQRADVKTGTEVSYLVILWLVIILSGRMVSMRLDNLHQNKALLCVTNVNTLADWLIRAHDCLCAGWHV